MGFVVTPDQLTQVAHDVGELSILSRTGGAPTLAVGMASILSSFLGGRVLMGIWYHFIILFEALFILTTVDAGTRVLRFIKFRISSATSFRPSRKPSRGPTTSSARRWPACCGAISCTKA